MIYNNLKKNHSPIKDVENSINYHFVNGPFVEIVGPRNKVYKIKFINNDTNQTVYETIIETNHWASASIKYFINWRIEVYELDTLIFKHIYNAKDKNIYIAFDSSSLGDSIAWIPYVLEFQKKHECNVIVSTFKNELFEEVYPEIKFVKPGTVCNDIYASYKIGWFYDMHKEPILPNTLPLQQTITNILGLDYQEIRPRIAHNPVNKFDGKIVTIATNSTAGCKFWTREEWQDVINFLHEKGYKVINVSKEDNPFDNCQSLDDRSLQNTMDAIVSSEFYIGLSSGLSWLAWALGKKVFMIANFTESFHEFSCIRITNTNVCHGCWNNPNFKFDKGDWNWCPIMKNTPKHFQCHRSISSEMVIKVIYSNLLSTELLMRLQ